MIFMHEIASTIRNLENDIGPSHERGIHTKMRDLTPSNTALLTVDDTTYTHIVF